MKLQLITFLLVNIAVAAVIKDVKYQQLNVVGRAVDKIYPIKEHLDKRGGDCCLPGTEKRDILGIRCIPATQFKYILRRVAITNMLLTYVVNKDITRAIDHVLEYIDKNNEVVPVLYVNGTLPNKLFNLVNDGPYNIKHHQQKMQAFNYQKVDHLQQLYTLLADHTDHVVIVEDMNQIVNLTRMEYSGLNELIVDILTAIKRNGGGFIIDTKENEFVGLNCADVSGTGEWNKR